MKEKLLFVGNSVLPIYFSSAGKGPFMAIKAKKKKYVPEVHSPGGRGVVENVENLGAKFSETSFHHFKTLFMQIGHCYLYTTIIKTIDSNNFTLSSMFSFQNAWPIKSRKAVYM